MTRPSGTANLNITVTNCYSDNNIKQAMSVFAAEYSENYPEYPAWNNDYLTLRIRGGANVSEGFIYSIRIAFSPTEADAHIIIRDDFRTIELNGCKENVVRVFGDHNQEAYFEASAVDQPRNCDLGILVAWIFLDDNTTDHRTTVTLQTVYFSGAVYRQVNTPIISEVIAG